MTVYAIETDKNLFGTVGNPTDPIGSDGVVPRKFWVSPNGTDGDGNGRPDAPFQTITFALTKCVTGRGDTIYIGPGSYAENVNVNVANVALIGTGGRHNGITQIIGSATADTTTGTVYVGAGYLAGFKLANVELDSNGTAHPALWLVTNDTGASPSATAGNYRARIENVAVRSDDPDIGILLEGATLCEFSKIHLQGPTIGLAFIGSGSNVPNDLRFEEFDFMDCVTADIATIANLTTQRTQAGTPMDGAINLQFWKMRHWDRGGTPVTNYVNFAGSDWVNSHFFDCWAARDVDDGTLLELPANVVWIGESAAAAEHVIGS